MYSYFLKARKLSPTPPSRNSLDTSVEKDEGISDEEDPAELRVLLELNEQVIFANLPHYITYYFILRKIFSTGIVSTSSKSRRT